MKKFFIKTYGCQMNERDSELVRSQLLHAGFEYTKNESDADIVILNTCSIREFPEIKAIGKAQQIVSKKRHNPDLKVGIIGCMAENFGKNLFKTNKRLDFIIGPRNIANIATIIDQCYRGKQNIISIGNTDHLSDLTHFGRDISEPQSQALVSIMQGCNMHCSYCIVPKTRGAETYKPTENIIAECEFLAQKGIKEVMLLGQIVNSYGQNVMPIIDKKTPFVQLLEKINAIDGIERIRYISPHPNCFHRDLILAHKNLPKLCPHVHLPIQSGSDKILREMKRNYTSNQVRNIIAEFRENVPNISITTDIIVGFPGETDEEFQQTINLFDEIQFDMAFIFKFSARGGTPAAERNDTVNEEIKEHRNKILLKKLEKFSQEKNKKFLNEIVQVLVNGKAKRGENIFYGLTPNHYKVLLEGSSSMIGKVVPIKITNFATTTLYGELVR